MKKIATLLAATLSFAACEPAEDPANQYRAALPQAASVQLATPDSTATGSVAAGALAVRRDAMVDSPSYQSEYATASYWTALTVNVGVWWTLELLQAITRFPPSACDDASCTWGPWRGDDALNYWKLHVAKANGAYEYALSAQPASDAGAPWATLVSGTARPGADRDHGAGSFVIDFDAQTALQHPEGWQQEDFGTLAVDYDNTAGTWVKATFEGAVNDDPARPHPMNAVYRFDATGPEGDLQIAFVDLTTTEVFSMRTRWVRGTGEGRADAHYVGFDQGAPVEFDATECWAGKAYLWAEDFDRKAGVVFLGTEANCAPFLSAPDPLLTVALP